MATTDNALPTGQPQPLPDQGGQAAAPTIDVRKLAEKVYRLLLADLRQEQARGARARPRE